MCKTYGIGQGVKDKSGIFTVLYRNHVQNNINDKEINK